MKNGPYASQRPFWAVWSGLYWIRTSDLVDVNDAL